MQNREHHVDRFQHLAALASAQARWTPATVSRYGRTDTVELADIACLWYGVYRSRTVRVILLRDPGRRTTAGHAIRLYTLTELAAMLGRAGLELLAVHGDLDGGPLELDSSFLVTLSGRAGKGIS